MFIVWGSRGRTSVQSSGEFFCPDCGTRRSYDLVEVKKWFTLYWIPIFPMSTLGQYVECGACKATYNEQVLEYDPEAANARFEAAFAVAAKRVMFKMALADGEVDPGEVDQIATAFANITGREIDADDIAAELTLAEDDPETVQDYLVNVAPHLNDSGKEIVLRAAIAVAKADGHIDPSEVKLLSELGKALDMPDAYAKGVLADEGVPA